MEDQSCLAAADSQGEIFVAEQPPARLRLIQHYTMFRDGMIFSQHAFHHGSILWYKTVSEAIIRFGKIFLKHRHPFKWTKHSQSIYVAGCNYLGFQLDTFNIPPKSIFLVKIRYDGITEWVKWASSVYQGAGAARIFPGDLHLQNPTSIQWFFSSRDSILFNNQSFAPAAYLMGLQADGNLISMVPVMQGVDAIEFSSSEMEHLFVAESWNDTIFSLGDTTFVSNCIEQCDLL